VIAQVFAQTLFVQVQVPASQKLDEQGEEGQAISAEQNLPFVAIDGNLLSRQIVFAVIVTSTLISFGTRGITANVNDCTLWTNTAGCTIFSAIHGARVVLSVIATRRWT
jgi:hypothetical protein